MGASSSRIEDDKALLLCRERKRFVRQALDGRCSLADSHISYIQSLRNTGTALRKFVEPEAPAESSLYTSTSATPEPLALTDKSTSQFSNSSPSVLQNAERGDSFSPVISPNNSARYHVNHMKASRSSSTTIEEAPPISVRATLRTSTTAPKSSESQPDEDPSAEPSSPPPDTPPWDYFGLFHPIDNQFSFQEGKLLSQGFDNADDIRRLREEEGIPELEEEVEKGSTNEKGDFEDSEDDFDQTPTEPLVRIFKNRNEILDHQSVNASPPQSSMQSNFAEIEQQNSEKKMLNNGIYDADKTPETTPSKHVPSPVTHPVNGLEKESAPDNKFVPKDLFCCIKEIEDLFLKASDSGRDVPRMLEANKVHFRPLFPEETAHQSKANTFLAACFSCCTEETHIPQEPASNDIKYLTWHRSASSRSSSSRNPLGAASREDIGDLSSNLFSSMCMNSGSHASTLDRLFAWERKLYDEVKASGIIRREYDLKCRLLRHQDSKGESINKIYKTRATVKDLHSRVRVAIHRIDSISKRIEELRDKELQPQLEELIGGLTRMWSLMLNCHKNQYGIITVASSNGSTRVSIRSESHRQATLLLEFELNSLCSSFTKWISAHKSYLQAINGWLLKCVFPLKHKSMKKTKVFSPVRHIAPPIFVTCRDWLKLLDELPVKEVVVAIKDLVTVTTHFLPRQEKAHGSSILSFSVARKAGKHGEMGEIHSNETPVDWSLNYDSLQSGLVVFLDQLKTFAEKSVTGYEALQKSISDARFTYENSGSRT